MSAGRSRLYGFLRDTLREWRSPELRVLAAALVVAVAAVAAVGFFTDRVDRGMEQQAATLLGGDLAVVSDAPMPERWRSEARALGLESIRSATLPSVLFTPDDESLLVSVRAVDPGWPLRGAAQVAGDPQPEERTRGPTPGTAWADGAVLQALEIAPGASVELGRLPLAIDAQLLLEPDRGSNLFDIAPRLLIHFDDLDRTGLIGPGSRVHYQLLVAGPPAAVQDFRGWMQTELDAGQRLLDLEDANPELREAVNRARRFLGLASLMAVLLAGAAIAVAAHHYAEQRADAAAVMRALGARGRRVLRLFFLRVLAIAALASGIGLALGFAAQFVLSTLLGEWLATGLPPPGMRPVAAGLGVGLVTAAGFALPALLRIGRVPPLRVLRRDLGLPPVSVWLSGLLALLTFGALLYWQAADPALALWVLLGTVLALLLLGALGLVLIVLLRPLRDRGTMALRFGLANLSRRGGLSAIQMVAFSIGILALLLLAIVRVDLLAAWERNIPPDAPNLFFINIQPGEEQAFADRVAASGLPRPQMEPMIRGRLVAVNGERVRAEDFADERARRLLEREFNLSHAEAMPSHNRLAAGRWFDHSTGDEWSVESGLMERFGLDLGDELTFRVAGVPVSGRITSVRDVDWDSFQVNFFVIGPPALLSDQPRTYITSLHLPPEREADKNRWLREFPAVTAIDVAALLAQVRSVIDQATRAVEYVFLFTLFAGLTVLYAAVQATREVRRRETALLRTLGARRPQIRNALLAEFGTLGLLSGLLAAVIASAVGALLAWQVFGFDYAVNPMTFVLGIGGGALGIGLAGWLGTRQVLHQAPLTVLRGPE
ncbi:ABC transporter, permease protein, putative [Thioalkalivibrio nitratireducens DSM 14787]|uniref:ABC transporter, permease protein, putative n=1 Tax=Thioalkalivibrio nitratireducens (strain DSM 14787 / UNIQEM 213 / ALEN2) TaxID=1255043 RepID=L0DX74_THIND|nr:FtsX-like permease family protein [Thioalkalivibrio nitratireducens]AGA33648.1 ABC transporter, permease protein, putative [Thioalkalivibrio nitratireducens DSM 14787]